MKLFCRQVALPNGVGPAVVTLQDGRFAAVEPVAEDASPAEDAEDLGSLVLLPGLVDTHVHVNEPGRTHWEGFRSATRGAAAGGVTTIVDMPLNSSPVTTTRSAFELKLRAARDSAWVDYGVWGGLVPPSPGAGGTPDDLRALHEAGALGFKCFTCPSGIDDFPAVTAADLDAVLPVLAELGTVLLVHAEDPAALAEWPPDGDRRDPEVHRRCRPPEAESEAVGALVDLATRHRARLHVVHVSAAASLSVLAAARAAGSAVTAETCPHYLTFAGDEIPTGATGFKCAPPIRTAADREALWAGLADGVLDMVVSDHSPAPPERKELESGDFGAAWGGIASLQVSLPATWTGAATRGGTLGDLARWMSAAPASLAGLAGRKGTIAPGHDADMVLFDPDGETRVDGARWEHRHPVTPYQDRVLRGRVVRTWLRGRMIYDGSTLSPRPIGRWLRRPDPGAPAGTPPPAR